ncbi:MAG: GTP 3',8-cyclase MoaA, partial [bacterium]|nr:GTP 3',8-cyclase MoaA [bacterium]
LLTFEEIERLVSLMVRLGVEKVRITGGEPLIRKDLPVLVEKLARIDGLKDLAMTTNGVQLKRFAADLAAAGLRRINVSLDSLQRDRFFQIVRRDALDKVLEGLEELERHPSIRPIKVNVVTMRGMNDDEMLAFAKLAMRKPYIIRFIEFMPLDAQGEWRPEQVLTGREVFERINAYRRLVPIDTSTNGSPDTKYRFEDGSGEIGFINSVSEPFCSSCDRIRITADGHFRNCLFALEETDLKGPLRAGASDEELAALIRQSVRQKWAGHLINRKDFQRPSRSMSQIGG